MPENLPFRVGDENVARPGDFVHAGDALCAEREGGNGLRAADFVDFVHTRQIRRDKGKRVADRAVPAGRRDHDNLLYARDLRRQHVHQHRRGVRRRAAGDVHADALEGCNLLPQRNVGVTTM